MRFGSWTFDKKIRLKRERKMANLKDYNPSGIWDIIEAPGTYYHFSDENNKMELVYTFKIRRKTLFYTVNLIIPTVFLCFLSIFVFYLPADDGEKMTFCISILLALIVFLLLVSRILPPTSTSIPLISKYLLFTFIMNILTILNTVIIINWNYSSPCIDTIPKWIRIVFIDYLPKILFMNNFEKIYDDEEDDEYDEQSLNGRISKPRIKKSHSMIELNSVNSYMKLIASLNRNKRANSYVSDKIQFNHDIMRASHKLAYITNHIKCDNNFQKVT
jgi:nicotinic acetylcholine receptor, invertebrate